LPSGLRRFATGSVPGFGRPKGRKTEAGAQTESCLTTNKSKGPTMKKTFLFVIAWTAGSAVFAQGVPYCPPACGNPTSQTAKQKVVKPKPARKQKAA
jgi:hypothetical protein